MTRETIENLVLEATGRTDKSTLITSAVNLAVEEISTQRLWADLQTEDEVTTVNGDPSVELAEDLARIMEIRLIDGQMSMPLIVRSKAWISKYFPAPEERNSAKPVYAYLEGRNLFFVPVPDGEYTIRYTYHRLHPELATPTSPLLIRGAGRAVAAYATFWVFQSLEKAEDADRWLKSYFALLESVKKVDKSSVTVQMAEPRGMIPQAGPDPWLDPFVRRTV